MEPFLLLKGCQMKLIVIDGGDGCGKATQANKLYESLKKENYNVFLIMNLNIQHSLSLI